MNVNISSPLYLKINKSVFVLSLLLLAFSNPADSEERVYTLGVFPHLPPKELEKVFSPIAADLAKSTGKKFKLRSNTTFDKFSDSLGKKVFDVAFLQPFDYISVSGDDGYQAVATRTEPLSAVLVTLEEKPYSKLDELKGMRIAFPPETSAVRHLFQSHIESSGYQFKSDFSVNYHRSHLSCMQQVVIGDAEACVSAAPMVRFFEHKMKRKMKVIAESKKIPHALFAIHSRVPEKDKAAIKRAILSWGTTEEGKRLLTRGRLNPFKEIDDTAYDVIRKMKQQ
ncbi:MAG: phosphate/phosphite/phosphonate ABC transporter substrate-binding protein [Gammaproteobacteria bacterium]|nr:phosphate/phosphite/phosphonate ABC transporter substrate-binding protein [Gammaproteobacteria bacterium]MDH5692484.1 phosphate/phosphite/phosphonate ABC transporter substrate-binding protein [Gammaproteobacteria bacterium]